MSTINRFSSILENNTLDYKKFHENENFGLPESKARYNITWMYMLGDVKLEERWDDSHWENIVK